MKKYNIDIFNKSNYLDYINKNYNLSECLKKLLIHYYNSKFNFFVNTNSNKQITTFFKEAINTNNIEEITRLQLLFMHFINFKGSVKVIEDLKNKKYISDEDIINSILKSNKNNEYNNNNNNNNNICDKWIYAIENLSLIYIKYLKPKTNNLKNIKYLDICCGNGKKTGLFSKHLKLNKENTYCTDIETWGPYKNKTKIKYQFKPIINGKLNYESDTFDICTCILSLHHIDDLNNFIKEINRIIKPGGYFLLIDHSVYNDYDRLFINIQHMLYSVFYDKRKNYLENPDFIYCYNMYEWNYIITKNNFYLKKEDILSFGKEYSLNYDNIFYGFYQKKY